MKTIWIGGAVLAVAVLAAGGNAATPRDSAQAELSTLLNRQIRAEGSFFTAAEQKVIVEKCGYAPGEWDGFDASMIDGSFHCTNGRRLDDPQIRAVMHAAQPRIERRVNAVMRQASVRAAIDRVAGEATREALARLEAKRGR